MVGSSVQLTKFKKRKKKKKTLLFQRTGFQMLCMHNIARVRGAKTHIQVINRKLQLLAFSKKKKKKKKKKERETIGWLK